ncbi:DNA excision repair protein ERCC-6-like 2 [Penicillium cosmopolitanum]|uniref:DNA excision repair protein ERCC-6-like 2 n=1 Tax=Penicillium cosmopolitanum TaxID=1131564 RepID=A0A9X0B2Z5_9EURO|nr:DNA excision repair protein ERCC-6-like 2 [Penicillium cosmopolitanum]KAJ5386239.1 DNA excision repair protein ERCC-6-like 2 [Penicillium cosmopolitanum]
MNSLGAGTEIISIDSSDDDDLEPTRYSRAAISGMHAWHVACSTSLTAHYLQGRNREDIKIEKGPQSEPVKVQFDDSDDDFNDGEAAYKKFKDRKSTKRRRNAAATRKAKQKFPKIEESGDGVVSTSSTQGGLSIGAKKYLQEQRDNVPSEDELAEPLPDYLQKRRSQFNRKREHLQVHGLKIPPSYDDIEFSDDENLEYLQERPFFPDSDPPRPYEDIELPCSLGLVPAAIGRWLRPYQVDGVAFLHEMFVYQTGGILGDDMGLGKTIQVIAFLTAAYGKTGDERDSKRMRKMRRVDSNPWYPRTLIVCPGSLKSNWRAEFDRWGWWHVDEYHGPNKELALDAAKSGRVEILIMTYETYSLNKDFVNMVEWDCVIADECHKIKEQTAGVTKAMNEINALCRIGLTGTAIQNRYEELWTLLNWANPGKLGPMSEWNTFIAEPLKVGQSHTATWSQLRRARRTARMLVKNLLPRFFLRRMKTLIADQLPKKSDRVVFCPLTTTQAEAYESFLGSTIVEYIMYSTEDCDCGSGKSSGWCCRRIIPGTDSTWQSFVFPAIMVLQKLSNHLAILMPRQNDSSEKQEKELEMLQIALPDQWEELYKSRESIVNFANPELCGKWKVLRRLLKWWHKNGDKVLVFSHSVRLLKMLQMLFVNTSYNVKYFDGSLSYDERAKVVDEFNSDPKQFVFLISTKAGGVGLNITSANKVVVVDPNWNPAYDLQAQDRAYRIGQQRDVEVFRLVSAGTIEEIVYARQIYKQQQGEIGYTASSERRYFKGIQAKSDQKGEIFGLKNLFKYEHEMLFLREIINKTKVAESLAGVNVMDFKFKEEDFGADGVPMKDEDDGMSQLAAEIRGERDKYDDNSIKREASQIDPIQAILANTGVEYTHLNNEVIGPSRVEEQLSRRAQQAPDDPAANIQVFGHLGATFSDS